LSVFEKKFKPAREVGRASADHQQEISLFLTVQFLFLQCKAHFWLLVTGLDLNYIVFTAE
jgi:hypothetical protein